MLFKMAVLKQVKGQYIAFAESVGLQGCLCIQLPQFITYSQVPQCSAKSSVPITKQYQGHAL